MKEVLAKTFTLLGSAAILIGALMKIQHTRYHSVVLISGIVFFVLAMVTGYKTSTNKS